MEVLPESLVLDVVPPDADTDPQATPRQEVDIRSLSRDERGLTLRKHEDPGGEPDSLSDSGQIGEHHEGIVKRILLGVGAREWRRPIGVNRSEYMVIGEEMIKPQILDRLPKPPNRGGVPSKLDLGVHDAKLHDVQFLTRCPKGVDHLLRPGRTAILGVAMLFLPEAGGPSEPVVATIDRRPGSVRRTSTIDTARPDGFRGDLAITAVAHDLRTTTDATPVVVNQADLSLRVDGSNRQVLSIASSPALLGLDQLVGVPVGSGFRSRVYEACPASSRQGPCSTCCWTTSPVLPWSRVTRHSGPGRSIHPGGGRRAMSGARRTWPG